MLNIEITTKLVAENWDCKALSVSFQDFFFVCFFNFQLIQLIQTTFIPIFSIGCVIDFFKQMLKISAFYLEKQNILISKQNMI